MKTMTFTTDQIAALSLVYGTEAEQKEIARQLEVACGDRCPACGNTDRSQLEDNGAHWSDLTYLCLGCEHQWDAAEVTVRLPARTPRWRR